MNSRATKIYTVVAIACLLVSLYASVTLVMHPLSASWPVQLAEAVFGLLLFIYLIWVPLGTGRSDHSQMSRPGHVSRFFAPALLIGTVIGGGIAYWQGIVFGWSAHRAAGLALLVITISISILIALFIMRKYFFNRA
jgi:hypothetical protein